jgi:hypothetical protein
VIPARRVLRSDFVSVPRRPYPAFSALFSPSLRVAIRNATSTAVLVGLLAAATGCTTLRGRADDALTRGDYRNAVAIYSQVLAEHPNDPEAKAKLTRAERGLVDEALDRFEGDRSPATALAALKVKDGVHADAIDAGLAHRFDALVHWTGEHMTTLVKTETQTGRALAARKHVNGWNGLLSRRELAHLAPTFAEMITASGRRTCALATVTANDEPFALELVASYCKEVGGTMPPWRPRPLLVNGMVTRGTITGTPPEEQRLLEGVIDGALQRTVWYSPTANAKATAELGGIVAARFTATPTELSRSWTERVAYEATETYQDPIQVPYTDHETYYEQVPYTAYETSMENCGPRRGLCNKTRPVTRYRSEQRTRPVTRYRTEWVEKTRVVTRYRDEPRVFNYRAIKHEGRYKATYDLVLVVGSGQRVIPLRESLDDAKSAFEHDVEFAPAGVHPESGAIMTARAWRDQQRTRLANRIGAALDQAWVESFCSEGVATIEDAARCVHARPAQVPAAVRTKIHELVADDTSLVLSLPRPIEAITPSQ